MRVKAIITFEYFYILIVEEAAYLLRQLSLCRVNIDHFNFVHEWSFLSSPSHLRETNAIHQLSEDTSPLAKGKGEYAFCI